MLLKTMNAAAPLRSEEWHCSEAGGETPINQLLHFKARAPLVMVSQALQEIHPLRPPQPERGHLKEDHVYTNGSH